jgi:Tetratricopeptide repeat/NB-ARC domain
MSSGQDAPEAGVSQDIQAERDAFTAGRDLTVIYQYEPTPAGTGGPRAAGPTRQLWGHVPPRNPGFIGREELLARIRAGLLAGDRTAVQALQGIGGVGKTQLAVEYAHRFADSYDVVWWVSADQAGLTGNQFAELGENLGCVEPGTGLIDAARQATLAELRRRRQWLLVFDNAESPADLVPWLPGGNGHVLITSRTRQWAEIAVPVEVDVLTRAESVAILRTRLSWLCEADAEKVAAALGDLPLGVTQASGYMTDTGTSADVYLRVLETRAGQVLDLGRPWSYQQSLSAATILAFDALEHDDPASAALAAVCAFLAPAPVPVEWFTRNPAVLPAALASAAADPLTWHQALARISARALARIDPDGLRMHRLTQAIVRGHLSREKSSASRQAAEAIVAASHPGDERTPDLWPEWSRLLPHLTFLHPELSTNPGLRQLAVDATYYLFRVGYWQSSYDLADHLYQEWADQLGPDDPWTLAAAQAAGIALWKLGRHDDAAQLDEDTLTRRRRVLGEDHPDTLVSANAMAIVLRQLGRTEAARELDEDTLGRRRRVLGADHPQTLMSANTMTVILRGLGQNEAARDLGEDTLARRRRVLGEDHPDTLISASNLAALLRAAGQVQAARDLDEDTLARRRRVLGEDHPDTRRSAARLAANDDEDDEDDEDEEWDDDEEDWGDDEELQPEDMPRG